MLIFWVPLFIIGTRSLHTKSGVVKMKVIAKAEGPAQQRNRVTPTHRPSDSSTIWFIDRPIHWPYNSSTVWFIDHPIHQPYDSSTIWFIDHPIHWPSDSSTIRFINRPIHQPSNSSTIWAGLKNHFGVRQLKRRWGGVTQ
jgi:hypothetical protein